MVTFAVLFIALMFGSSPLDTSRLQLSYFTREECIYIAPMQIDSLDRGEGRDIVPCSLSLSGSDVHTGSWQLCWAHFLAGWHWKEQWAACAPSDAAHASRKGSYTSVTKSLWNRFPSSKWHANLVWQGSKVTSRQGDCREYSKMRMIAGTSVLCGTPSASKKGCCLASLALTKAKARDYWWKDLCQHHLPNKYFKYISKFLWNMCY